MNGIVVMDCVQTAYQGNYGIYGTRDRMIRISGRRAAAMTGTSILSNETSAVQKEFFEKIRFKTFCDEERRQNCCRLQKQRYKS